jgi:hypothetical protein
MKVKPDKNVFQTDKKVLKTHGKQRRTYTNILNTNKNMECWQKSKIPANS